MEHKTGEALAKVLWYYNLIPGASSSSQKIICPFHEDINPSMIANFEAGSFFCFGCNLSGDAIKFVKLMETQNGKLNDLQAYKKYLQILKSDKCSGIKLGGVHVKNKPLQRDLYNEAYDYYHGLKRINWRAPESTEEQNAKAYMVDRGFAPEVLNKCKAKVTYNHNYGLIFPMLDNGKFKGWVCRTMLKAIEAKRKYLYNVGFSRAATLVGDYGTKDYVFVVEGYMDRLKMLQFGEDNVVAILGWKMSPQQIQKLKDAGVKRIISALDNDECGKKGTEYLKQYFDVTKFSYLKGIKDPGDMNEKSFNKMLKRTMYNFKIQRKARLTSYGFGRQN